MGETVKRTLKVMDVAEQVGVTRRTVQLWSRLGCPCDNGARPGQGRNRLWFDLGELREWLGRQGLDATRGALFDGGSGRGSEGSRDRGEESEADEPAGRADRLSDEEIAGIDFIGEGRREILRMIDVLRRSKSDTAASVVSQLTKAIADLNKEQRQNDALRAEAEDRERTVMRRAAVIRAHEAIAATYRATAQGMGIDLPGVCVAAIAEAGVAMDAAHAESMQRLLHARIAEAIDRHLEQLAVVMEKAAGELGIAGEAAGKSAGAVAGAVAEGGAK